MLVKLLYFDIWAKMLESWAEERGRHIFCL